MHLALTRVRAERTAHPAVRTSVHILVTSCLFLSGLRASSDALAKDVTSPHLPFLSSFRWSERRRPKYSWSGADRACGAFPMLLFRALRFAFFFDFTFSRDAS